MQKKANLQERTPSSFLMAVAEHIEERLGHASDIYPNHTEPCGVTVDTVAVHVRVQFKAGKPFVHVQGTLVVRGLADLPKAVKKTAEAVLYELPAVQKAQARDAALERQEHQIIAYNRRFLQAIRLESSSAEPLLEIRTQQTQPRQLLPLRFYSLPRMLPLPVSELSEEQMEQVLVWVQTIHKAYAGLEAFLASLSAEKQAPNG